MKAHIDVDSGLVHTVVGTAANVNDVTQAHALVHGEEADIFADAGYQGVSKRRWVRYWTSWSRPRRAFGPRLNTRSG